MYTSKEQILNTNNFLLWKTEWILKERLIYKLLVTHILTQNTVIKHKQNMHLMHKANFPAVMHIYI